MPHYQRAEPASYWNDPWYGDVRDVLNYFEAFQPHPKPFEAASKATKSGAWPIVVPNKAPPVPDNLPQIIQKMVEATWTFAEPKAGVLRGFAGRAPTREVGDARKPIFIGSRGAPQNSVSVGDRYNSQVRPVAVAPDGTNTRFPNANAIATDWKVFSTIKRTNAIGFRGDTRSPVQVIGTARGFFPPNTRTDRDYLTGSVFKGFAGYMKERYGREVSQQDFMQAVDKVVATEQSKKLFIDYMTWRQITERESVHLGRMVENELLKGYISTSASVDAARWFGTGRSTKSGWVYIAIVHAGFVLPTKMQENWFSEEGEVSQLGPIPAERIVGFRRIDIVKDPKKGALDGPIFIRRGFRFAEANAFDYLFDALCGMTPTTPGYKPPPNVFAR